MRSFLPVMMQLPWTFWSLSLALVGTYAVMYWTHFFGKRGT